MKDHRSLQEDTSQLVSLYGLLWAVGLLIGVVLLGSVLLGGD